MNTPDYDLTYISLGAGVQSSAMLILSADGRHNVPRADLAIFADTKDEPPWVYEQLQRLAAYSKPRGIPVVVVGRDESLSEAMRNRWVPIPAFTWSESKKTLATVDVATDFSLEPGAKKAIRIRDDGILHRQCTSEFKIRPIETYVRAHLGYTPKQRVKKRARSLIGFSCDEVSRTKPSQVKWITQEYPLIDAGLYRGHCMEIVEQAGMPTPRKSACVFCPYHSDRFWAELKRDHPDQFARAVEVDHQIRDKDSRKEVENYQRSATGKTKGGITSDAIYLHRSLKPLDECDFGDQPSLWDDECTGHCGV